MNILCYSLIYILKKDIIILMETLNKEYLDNLIDIHAEEIIRRPYPIETGWGISLSAKKPKHVYVLGKNPKNVDYVRKGLLKKIKRINTNRVDIIGGGYEDIDGDYVINTD